MKRFKWLFLLVAYLGVAGFNTSNLYAPERAKIDLKPGYGRVIISTGAAKICTFNSMNLYIQSAAPGIQFRRSLMIDQMWQRSDFDDHPGFLNVVALKAGDYRIYSLFQAVGMTAGSPVHTFEVSAGETIYLGEYWLSPSCGGDNEGVFRDQSQRDLEMLKARNPALGAMELLLRLPAESGVRQAG